MGSDSSPTSFLKPDSRVTRWSDNIYDKQSTTAQAEAIARKYIKLLDEKLKARGISVLAGTEIEFDIEGHPERSCKALSTAANDGSVAYAIDHSLSAKLSKGNTLPDGSFSIDNFSTASSASLSELLSKTVFRAYKESEFRDMEIATAPLFPLQNCDATNMWKQLLFEGTYQGFKATTGMDLSRKSPEEIHAMRKAVDKGEVKGMPALARPALELIDDYHLQRVAFGKMDTNRFYGQHLNLSINAASNDAKTARDPKAIANRSLMDYFKSPLLDTLTNYAHHDSLLLYSGSDTFTRWRYRGYAEPMYYADSNAKGSNSERVEFKFPDSGSNNTFATLLGMASVYEMVEALDISTEQMEAIRKHQEPAASGELWSKIRSRLGDSQKVSKNLQSLTEHFEKHSITLRAMRDVAKEAGIDGKDIEQFQSLVTNRAKEIDAHAAGRSL